jgi:hypothetical protein
MKNIVLNSLDFSHSINALMTARFIWEGTQIHFGAKLVRSHVFGYVRNEDAERVAQVFASIYCAMDPHISSYITVH